MAHALSPLTAISPVDGRYAARVEPLRRSFSECGLIRLRVQVEIRWLEALSESPAVDGIAPLSEDAKAFLESLLDEFDESAAARVKAIERETNHDVKAVEYYLRERMAAHPELSGRDTFLHFACTSEDINNLAYGLALAEARANVLLPATDRLRRRLDELARRYAAMPMLSRTHGQAATPTTVGKEFRNFAARLDRAHQQIGRCVLRGKINGAVGNFNAHLAAYPEVDWISLSRRFVESLGLDWSAMTTQIEPHDFMAELFHALSRFNTVALDLCRDMWGYIALGYFRQRVRLGEVGSSTMPHKVNPIDFENAEGNLGVANALLDHLAGKLPVSRWQRDLSDSTALRNVGVALGHCLIAYTSCQAGLEKIELDTDRVQGDLDDAWEVLAEPVQTVMRRYGIADAYEQLKSATRGRGIDRETLHRLIEGLDIPEPERARLLEMTPADYIGCAATLAAQGFDED